MKKNICFFKNDTSGGGVERVTTIIANELANQNHEYCVYILDTVNPSLKTNYHINKCVRHYSLANKNRGKAGVITDSIKLALFLKKNKIDVLVTAQPMLGLYSLIAAKLANVKNIIWEHGNFYQKKGSKLIDFIRQKELIFCDYYLVLTKRDKINFTNNFHIKCPIDYIYNPISESKIIENYNTKSTTLMSAGHLRYVKGFDMLIDVAKIVFSKYPNWNWKIYGDGPDIYKIKEKILSYGLEKNVLLCGRTDNIRGCYSDSSIYVMTSRSEGLPMVLLEAKYHNLPIVSFDIETGPSEIIKDNVNGFLIAPYNIEIMAEKICKLIEDAELREEFSKASKDDMDKFNIKLILEKWVSIIDQLV